VLSSDFDLTSSQRAVGRQVVSAALTVYRIGSREIGLHLASLEPCDSLLPWDALLTGGSDSSWVFRMGNKSAQSAFPHRR
jgi:hypothetical protein